MASIKPKTSTKSKSIGPERGQNCDVINPCALAELVVAERVRGRNCRMRHACSSTVSILLASSGSPRFSRASSRHPSLQSWPGFTASGYWLREAHTQAHHLQGNNCSQPRSSTKSCAHSANRRRSRAKKNGGLARREKQIPISKKP